MLNENAVKKRILRNLISPPRWGGKHTEFKNIKKNLPSVLTSNKKGQKLINKVIKEIINDGWLLAKKSTGEIHVSLNPKKRKEIIEFLI